MVQVVELPSQSALGMGSCAQRAVKVFKSSTFDTTVAYRSPSRAADGDQARR